jgi:hydroxymethylpyrimidine pyrophosphatase-like HAD family hydrolase
MIRLVVSDAEGVLAPAEGSHIPWNLEGLLKVRQFINDGKENIICILCTGRQSAYSEALIQALGLFFEFPENESKKFQSIWNTELFSWPSIVENGTCFYDPMAKRVIPNPEMTKTQIESIKEIQSEVIPLLVEKTKCQVEAGKNFSVSLNPPIVSYGPTTRVPVTEFFLVVKESLREFQNTIEIKHSASAVDIVPKGISKASAVKFLLDNTGMDPLSVLGIGDTEADKEWLKLVGWSATPANGREKLKDVHYVSPYEEERGLLDILENLRNHKYEKVG